MASWTDKVDTVVERAEELQAEAKRKGEDGKLAAVVADLGQALQEAAVVWGEKRES